MSALRDSSCSIGSAIKTVSGSLEEKSKKQFNDEHPDKSYSADVFKDFATKWECMTNAEKAPYLQEAEMLNTEHVNLKHLKDPNVQKRLKAFKIYLEKSKKQFNDEHPDKFYFAYVFKDFATKWECMTNAEKAPYLQEVEMQNTEHVNLKHVKDPNVQKRLKTFNIYLYDMFNYH
ncbi:hypothetical protein CCACVL1_03460 [Corchorus capsularis]|uniref:HMG box domain-containing protein n=1 Tax=Corchorus capsularis TaxID=210143 RepID=A0A1R3JZ61_COCAP|nr:hypothetical protein CCACVL1_03460 [Corchorus capsularis]